MHRLPGAGGCGLYDTKGTCHWDAKGRLQVAMERPVGKQLRLLLRLDRQRKLSSCGKGSSSGFLDDSPCLSPCCLSHIPKEEGHSRPTRVLTYKFKPSLLDSAESTKSSLCWCRLLVEAAGLGQALAELLSHSSRASYLSAVFIPGMPPRASGLQKPSISGIDT